MSNDFRDNANKIWDNKIVKKVIKNIPKQYHGSIWTIVTVCTAQGFALGVKKGKELNK
jgi:adenine/guanine phosphoribosyltransferase-like PRPP-binding protein